MPSQKQGTGCAVIRHLRDTCLCLKPNLKATGSGDIQPDVGSPSAYVLLLLVPE